MIGLSPLTCRFLSRREGLYLIMTIYVSLPGAGIPYDGGWPGKAGT
jgi:hypothetical protein